MINTRLGLTPGISPPTAAQVEMVKKANEAIAAGGQPNTDTGWFDFSGPEPEELDKAQQQVALWNEMQGMLQAAGGAPSVPVSDEPGSEADPQADKIDALIDELLNQP